MILRRPTASITLIVAVVILTTFLVSYTPHSPSFLRQQPLVRYRPTNLLDDINNSTFGFEKIFVVGLPERTDRRDGMLLSAAVSDATIEFIDGIRGSEVVDSAIPASPGRSRLEPGPIGAWRAHLNAIHEVVRRNLSSALILEDDVDWDVRIRPQLQRFALSTQALTQPLAHNPQAFADPSYLNPTAAPADGIPDIPLDRLPKTIAPSDSPYGDNWDMLWLGHCAMEFPSLDNIPKGRVTFKDDDTVAEKRYLWSFSDPYQLKDYYPEHTRVTHHAQGGVCALGYAVSQRGARGLLKEVALKGVGDAYDILMRYYCDGLEGRRRYRCLTTQPGLFHHHRPVGSLSAQSDIGNHGDGYRDQPMTDAVRWSTRMNADVLLDGGNVFHDSFPNES